MLIPFLLVLVALSFSVSGELMLKSAMNQIGTFSFSNFLPSLGRILSHPRIWGGFGLFALGAFWWLAVLSRVNLSWAYPMLAIGYIMVLVFSAIILKEHVSLIRWAGAVVICVGIYLIFRS